MYEIPETGFLRLPQVLGVIPLGKTCWSEGVKSGRFPPTGVCSRRRAWSASCVSGILRVTRRQALIRRWRGPRGVGLARAERVREGTGVVREMNGAGEVDLCPRPS
jgi:prophage regulatory protein